MIKRDPSTCSNCARPLPMDSKLKNDKIIREIWMNVKMDSSQKVNEKEPIQVHTAVSAIYKLDYFDNNLLQQQDKPGGDDEGETNKCTNNNVVDISICQQCGEILQKMYKYYDKFNKLRLNTSSYLAQRIQQVDDILHQFQLTWNEMQDHENQNDDVEQSDENPIKKNKVSISPAEVESSTIHNKDVSSAGINIKEQEMDTNTLNSSTNTLSSLSSIKNNTNCTSNGPWVRLKRLSNLEIALATARKADIAIALANALKSTNPQRPSITTTTTPQHSPITTTTTTPWKFSPTSAFRCPLCPQKYFNTGHALRQHLWRFHVPPLCTTCPICGEDFNGSRRKLSLHFKEHDVSHQVTKSWTWITVNGTDPFLEYDLPTNSMSQVQSTLESSSTVSTPENDVKNIIKVEPTNTDYFINENEDFENEIPATTTTTAMDVEFESSNDSIHEMSWSYICPYCNVELETKSQLISHANMAHNQNLLCCELLDCNTCFESDQELALHMNDHQSKPWSGIYSCTICGQKFASQLSMWGHNKATHKNEII